MTEESVLRHLPFIHCLGNFWWLYLLLRRVAGIVSPAGAGARSASNLANSALSRSTFIDVSMASNIAADGAITEGVRAEGAKGAKAEVSD